MADVDAVVIGSGPNGLVAANVLADAGWDVLVLEAEPDPGGAVRSAELTEPGFTHDRFSAFYPLAAVSPPLRRLDLEAHGLRWQRAPLVLGNPTPDGRAAILSTDIAVTRAALDEYAPGDGAAWEATYREWKRIGTELVAALMSPFPPVAAGSRLAARLGPLGALRFARFALSPVRRFGAETFAGEGAQLLLAGAALHTDLGPDSATGAIFGWLLACLGQEVGFPVPEGGSGQLTAALVRRLESRRGTVRCSARVTRVEVRAGRAVGVICADGTDVGVKRAVLADTGAPALYRDLVGTEHLPARLLAGLETFEYDHGTFKVDWALAGPVPWSAGEARQAAVVHAGDSVDDLRRFTAEVRGGALPSNPYLVIGQQSLSDPGRAPPGQHVLWAYSRVPSRPPEGDWAAVRESFADAIDRRIEGLAPGFRALVKARRAVSPDDLERMDANLVGGDLGGGSNAWHRQLLFRPLFPWFRYRMPVRGLYLCSSYTHPGAGVHGMCGYNAARIALRDLGVRADAVGPTAGSGRG